MLPLPPPALGAAPVGAPAAPRPAPRLTAQGALMPTRARASFSLPSADCRAITAALRCLAPTRCASNAATPLPVRPSSGLAAGRLGLVWGRACEQASRLG